MAQPVPAPAADVQAAPSAVSLDLICQGEGRAKRTVTFGTTKMKPGQLPKAPPSFTGDISFRGSARVRIREGGRSEILLPRQLLSDGNHQLSGFKEIRKLEIASDMIKGKVALSIVYEPKFMLDRQLGELTVAGSQSSFTANCDPLDATQRRF